MGGSGEVLIPGTLSLGLYEAVFPARARSNPCPAAPCSLSPVLYPYSQRRRAQAARSRRRCHKDRLRQ